MKLMKKSLFILLIGLFCFLLLSCEQQVTPKPDPDPDPKPIIEKTTKEILDEFALKVEPLEINIKHSDLTNSDYEYLYFGKYPAREVTDPSVVEKLSKISEVNESGYLELDGYEFKEVTVVNNHKYAIPEQQTDEVFEYGTGYVPGTTHYFLVEPICWKILKVTGNEYLLQSEQIIETKPFNTNPETYVIDDIVHYPSEYENTTIRSFLNNDFFNLAFSALEQELFIEVTNANNASIVWLTEQISPRDTVDLVFLPSYQEVLSFALGFINSPICDDSRKAQATDYANALGLIDHTVEGFTTSIWAIRTSYEYVKSYMSYVGYDGLAGTNFYLDAENVGIRPFIKIRIDA